MTIFPHIMSSFTAQDLIYEENLFNAHHLLAHRTYGVKEDEHWLCIGGDVNRLPSKSATSHFSPLFHSSSDNHDNPHLCPRWYSTLEPHNPYLPDASYALERAKGDTSPRVSWVYQQYNSADTSFFMTGPSSVGHIRESLWRTMEEDFEIAIAVLKELVDITGLRTSAVDLTYTPDTVRYADNRRDCLQLILEAQSRICGMISAVAFHLSYLDKATRARFERVYGAFFRGWLFGEPRLGALVDPNNRNMHTYPILKLIEDGCPVYLPWDYQHRPTTSVESRRALSALSNAAYVQHVNNAFPRPTLRSSTFQPTTLFEHAREFATTCRCVFGDVGRPTFYPQYQSLPLSCSENVLHHGFLLVSPDVEIRLCHFSLTTLIEEAHPGRAIVTYALKRGLPFKLGFRTSAYSAFHGHVGRWRSSPPSIFNASITSMYIRRGLTRASGWTMYLQRVASLLAQPQAPGVLMGGGVLARIALEFGTPDLVERLLEGPSYKAYPMAEHAQLFSDQPTDVFCSILLGYTEVASGGLLLSWFPPAELVEEYLGCEFEWTPACEEWFCGRIKSLREMSSFDARPLSRVEWIHQLKTYTLRMFAQRSCTSPTNHDIEQLRIRMDRVCGRRHMSDWACRQLSSFGTTVVQSGGLRLNVAF